MDNNKIIFSLREETGCSLLNCKKAVEYCTKHPDCSPLGYLKAISFAVSTPTMSLDERIQYFSRMD